MDEDNFGVARKGIDPEAVAQVSPLGWLAY